MTKLKILNLYSGIGGNRKLWGNEHDITAVEIVPEIAAIYKDLFPNDTVVVDDAHAFLSESGLKPYAADELIVDWIAWHIDKIKQVIDSVEKN